MPSPALKPEITPRFGGYDVIWPAPACLSIAVRRVHVHTAGRVTGELEICRDNGSGPKILLPSSEFNFSAARTRSSLAKEMAERCADLGVDWLTVIEKLANDVQQHARTGEEAIEILPDANTPPPERILYPVLFKGVSNLIWGDKGVNKSTLAYYIAICVALPWDDNPLGFRTIDKPLKTLILDYENPEYVFRHYMACLLRGHPDLAHVPGIFYRHCNIPIADDIEAIANQVDMCQARLLIIDSLGAAAGSEREGLNSAEAARRFNSGLDQIPVTKLIIGQTSKLQDGTKTLFGSTFFRYFARNLFELVKASESIEDNVGHLALFHRDANYSKKARPLGIHVTYETDSDENNVAISFSPEEVSVSDFADKVSTSSRIYELLRNGPVFQKDLVAMLHISFPTCGMAINRLIAKKQVARLDDGKLGLVVKNEIDMFR